MEMALVVPRGRCLLLAGTCFGTEGGRRQKCLGNISRRVYHALKLSGYDKRRQGCVTRATYQKWGGFPGDFKLTGYE